MCIPVVAVHATAMAGQVVAPGLASHPPFADCPSDSPLCSLDDRCFYHDIWTNGPPGHANVVPRCRCIRAAAARPASNLPAWRIQGMSSASELRGAMSRGRPSVRSRTGEARRANTTISPGRCRARGRRLDVPQAHPGGRWVQAMHPPAGLLSSPLRARSTFVSAQLRLLTS